MNTFRDSYELAVAESLGWPTGHFTAAHSFWADVLDMDFLVALGVWDKRWDVQWYVERCYGKFPQMTVSDLRQCAERWAVGKRKVSLPFTKTRKRAAAKARRARASVPQEVLDQIAYVLTLPIAQNVNEKSINALVGMVLKKHKYNPQVIKELIKERVTE